MKFLADHSIRPAALPAVRRAAVTVLTAAALLPLGSPAAQALVAVQHIYWDPAHLGAFPGSGGDGLWDATTPNWVGSFNSGDQPYNGSTNGGPVFAGAAGTVNLNAGGLAATAVEFDTAGYVLQDAPGTGYALTVTTANTALSAQIASGSVTVSLPVNLTSTIGTDINARTGGTLLLAGTLTASSSVNFGNYPNTGTVVLSGNNALGGIVRVDEGTLRLAGTGTNQPLGGTTSLTVSNGGTLLYAAANQVPAGVPVTMFANGTINVNGQSQDTAHALGALTLSGDAALDFGGAAATALLARNAPAVGNPAVLAFGDSHEIAWSGKLSIYNFRGTPLVGGGLDQLFFGADAGGLSAAQLADITFYAGGPGSAELGTGVILSDGEVTYTPVGLVPEPSTWALLGLGAAGLGLTLRRRALRA